MLGFIIGLIIGLLIGEFIGEMRTQDTASIIEKIDAERQRLYMLRRKHNAEGTEKTEKTEEVTF